jgi:SET domain-containing protein
MSSPAADRKPAVPASKWVEFRPSRIHGTGAFAIRKIRKGTRVIEYLGRRIDKAESARLLEEQNPFIFDVDETFDLDGNVDWNPARFINHSCAPNCEAENDEGRIWIVALRTIQPGEELSFNYGYDIADYRDHPCECGAESCLGYMVAEEFFETVRRNEAVRQEGRKERQRRPA